MAMKNKVKIIWNDAVLLSPNVKTKKLSKMETIGFLVEENDKFIIVSEPKTINIETRQKHPKKQPTFYFIPKGMVVSMEKEKINGKM